MSNNNKRYLGYEEIIIPLFPGDDLPEMIDRVGNDFEGTHTNTVYILDKGIYKFPVILLGNRIFYGYSIIKQYYQDIADNKPLEEINARISNYAIERLSSPVDNRSRER